VTEAGARGSVVAENLTKVYRSGHRVVRALDAVSFEVRPGQTLAVIGESGSGKSTLTRLITGLEGPTEGRILISGEPSRLRSGRPASAQLIFQDPAGSLNPYRKIWKSVAEPLRHLDRQARRTAATEMLTRVGIDPARHGDRPGRFSGGQLQRVAIARTLVARADVLLCDEPTSALDVSVQAQILNLLRELQQDIGFTCVFVTHDLAVAQVVADHIMVLRDGQVREHAAAGEFFAGPRDPYSRALIAATGRRTHPVRPPTPAHGEDRR
jgi:ABC-type dipeptide/oligopeptide/nickel transport system ATPase subunit